VLNVINGRLQDAHQRTETPNLCSEYMSPNCDNKLYLKEGMGATQLIQLGHLPFQDHLKF
jgi:hypothetical protein